MFAEILGLEIAKISENRDFKWQGESNYASVYADSDWGGRFEG